MILRRKFRLKLPSGVLILGERTLIMGVLNLAPDSFFAGSRAAEVDAAVRKALEMQQEGADILDIGAESTRPGSQGVSVQEEMARLLPALAELRGRLKVPISVDTQKAVVAESAARAGAEIINDVSGLRTDSELADVVRRYRLALVLMHMRGRPRTMQRRPFARNVLRDVLGGLREALARARRADLPREQVILDPGIGFGKSFAQNYELLARLPEVGRLGFPLLVGPSRKTFIGATLGQAGIPPRQGRNDARLPGRAAGHGAMPKQGASREGRGAASGSPVVAPPEERLWGTAAAVTAAILGGAHIIRVHDVAEMRQVALVADAVLNES